MQRISLRHDLTLDNGKGRVIKIYITRYDITRFTCYTTTTIVVNTSGLNKNY